MYCIKCEENSVVPDWNYFNGYTTDYYTCSECGTNYYLDENGRLIELQEGLLL